MSDIIERLRNFARDGYPVITVADEAADEIERLRATAADKEKLLQIACDQIERLTAALAWYADFEHWRGHGMQDAETIHDCGEIARRALEGK